MKLELLPYKMDPTPLLEAIIAHPELWDTNRARTSSETSPHREMSDIWVRYAGQEIINDQHVSEWLDAADVLPVKEYAETILSFLGSSELGGILITRQPPGATCYPHIDAGKGSWHADYFSKVGFQVLSAPGQYFHVEELKIEPMPGDLFYFDNAYEHWVTNQTPYDRITLIVCYRPQC